MKKLLIAIIGAGVLAGCANLEGRDTLVVRVTEAGGTTGGIVTQGLVSTCTVEQVESSASAAGKGSISVAIAYQGAKCAVQAITK